MVCDMKGVIDKVVDYRFGDGRNGIEGKASTEDKKMFERLVEEEKAKDEEAHGSSKSRSPKTSLALYKARAALGLIQLLSSILG